MQNGSATNIVSLRFTLKWKKIWSETGASYTKSLISRHPWHGRGTAGIASLSLPSCENPPLNRIFADFLWRRHFRALSLRLLIFFGIKLLLATLGHASMTLTNEMTWELPRPEDFPKCCNTYFLPWFPHKSTLLPTAQPGVISTLCDPLPVSPACGKFLDLI
jgi:hypothetical protein